MKKVILTAVAVFAFGFANAQSHAKGGMEVNVIGGFLMGSSTSKADVDGAEKSKATATGAQFGVNFQYGLADNFSAGIGLETGTTILTPKSTSDADFGSTSNFSISTLKVILSGRYYILNKDKFCLFAGPSVGYTSGKDKTAFGAEFGGTDKTKYTGLNYGVNVGGNYFFTDVVGIIVNLGYEGNSLKGTLTSDGEKETSKTSLGGVKVMAGLALKF